MPLTELEQKEILKQGRLYYPASSHYNSGGVVKCDNCLRNNLSVSIGYGQLDMCLSCTQLISDKLKSTNENDIYTGINITLMEQDMFSSHRSRMFESQTRN